MRSKICHVAISTCMMSLFFFKSKTDLSFIYNGIYMKYEPHLNLLGKLNFAIYRTPNFGCWNRI
jgi:hypothetical protein